MERSQAADLDGAGGPAGRLLRHLYAVPQGSRYGRGGWWWSAEGPQPEGTAALARVPARICPKCPLWERVLPTVRLGPQPVGTSAPTAEETVAWILPFTSGGFLYIALVNVLPDLLEEEDPW